MKPWIIYGSELSPFTLKLQASCRFVGMPTVFSPPQCSGIDNLAIQIRLHRLRTQRIPLTWPRKEPADEFPLVPFLFGPGGENLYDSTAIAVWLDDQWPGRSDPSNRLIPQDPVIRFLTLLINDYADEWGLYLVHHQRWVVSASDNNAGERLAQEYRSLLPMGMRKFFARRFAQRQVRRLPYLFSVASQDHHDPQLDQGLSPPSRDGFPETGGLLEASWIRLMQGLDNLLKMQPWLFGECCTLADLALYGQLAINLDDPSSARTMMQRYPVVYEWLHQIRHGTYPAHNPLARPEARDCLQPLLTEVCRTHIPLMQQNYRAYVRMRDNGQTLFNEAAFNKNEALYNGEIDGQVFRAVAKSFQYQVWRRCCQRWRGLNSEHKKQLATLHPDFTDAMFQQ